MKTTLLLFSVLLILSGCADNKDIKLNGRVQTFQPYGWADYDEVKNDSIIYKVNPGNIFWIVIFSETLIIPIWLTGWQLYEPDRIKSQYNGPTR